MLSSLKSSLLLLLTAVIWGFAFVSQKVSMDYVGAFTFGGIRFLLGGLSLIPIIFLFERKQINRAMFRKTVLPWIAGGLILFTASTLQQFGIDLTDTTGKSGFITGLYTVLVPVCGVLFFHQKQRILTWIAAALAVIGLFLLCFSDTPVPTVGDGLLFAGTLFWTAHIIVVDRLDNDIPRLLFCSTQFLVCGILGTVCALIFEKISLSGILDAAFPILYGGLGSVGVAYTLQTIGQKGCDPSLASIILSLESVFSAIGGALLLGDRMTPRGYLGCVLIFAGIIAAQLPERKHHDSSHQKPPRNETCS